MTHFADQEDSQSIIEAIINRIGFGKYHIRTYFFFFCAFISEGAGMVTMTLLNYILMYVVWKKSLEEISMISTSVFIGCSIGSAMSGPIADRYGRKGCYAWSAMLVSLSSLASAFSPNLGFLIMARGIFGLSFGLMIPSAISYGAELSPKKYRGIDYINLNIAFISGELIGVGIAAGLGVDQPESENWRVMLIWDGVPGLIAALCFWRMQYESPRWELLRDKEKGMEIFNEIHKINMEGKELVLTEEEKADIDKYLEKQVEKKIEPSVKDLFRDGWWKITLPAWGFSLNQSSLYYGNLFILPLVLDAIDNKEEVEAGHQVVHHGLHYLQIVILVLFEIPAQITVGFLIRNPRFGRRNSLLYVYFLYTILSILIYFFPSFINIGSPALRFLGSCAYSLGGTYVSELYHTKHRSTGLGYFNLIDRLGGIIMPSLMLNSLNISPTGPYLILSIQALIAFVCSSLLAYDTTLRDLDKTHHDEKEQVELLEYKKL